STSPAPRRRPCRRCPSPRSARPWRWCSRGGVGTTTYAENIGVMASSRVYSTAAYWVAGLTAIALAFLPKFGAAVATIPAGVAGGAGIILYGMIGMMG
ncbi:solute carrier family 23 protein, partial [Streptococcus pneumoniae]|uniref:solute carrier family 23 protein n=1 Tax=Streptococcus pneumoniae TaxID=1313 RepID=UPI003D662FC2